MNLLAITTLGATIATVLATVTAGLAVTASLAITAGLAVTIAS